ncbi:MAG: hypothetical protein ACKVQK_21540 [Burkholderiales bacterium]
MTEDDAVALAKALRLLTPSQKDWVRSAMSQFQLPHEFHRNADSDWIGDEVLEAMGDALRIHHALSRQPLTKDKFEYAFERALNLAGTAATLVESRTNRGHDITIAGVPVSLKTEAAANIKEDIIRISKWMELGMGKWVLPELRDLFLEHLRSYKRVFTLRCLAPGPRQFRYELVEIPVSLLLAAKSCRFEVKKTSKQKPKPGYAYIEGRDGSLKYALYFDGGTERKLQIRNLRKSLCTVHATWEFESTPL